MTLPVNFAAELIKSPAKGGHMYLVWPNSAVFFGTRGLVKVKGRIDGHIFTGAFMAMGGGIHKLPVAADIRSAIGKTAEDTVYVEITDRLK